MHCLWIDFQDTQIRKTTKRKYSQNSLKQQEVQRQYIIIVCILNRGVCTEVENLGSLMSLGQGELSVIKGCLYMGVGIVQSLVSLQTRELSTIRCLYCGGVCKERFNCITIKESLF